jgi:hypothetical protein
MIRRQAIEFQNEYATNGQPPRAQILWALRHRLEALIQNMQNLRAEEEAAREIEADIWRNLQ